MYNLHDTIYPCCYIYTIHMYNECIYVYTKHMYINVICIYDMIYLCMLHIYNTNVWYDMFFYKKGKKKDMP